MLHRTRENLALRSSHRPRISLGSLAGTAVAACHVAFWILAVGAVLIPLAVLALKTFGTPVLTAGEGENAIAIPLPWAYVALAAAATFSYLGIAALIFRQLIRLVTTLRAADPFHPGNVRRLHHIGLAFASVTLGVWIGQWLVARFVRGALAAPSVFDLLTPFLAVTILAVIAEVFRGGARMRRESELTI